MRDIGPDQMERFREIETKFLEVTRDAGYREIRTPTVEPLHLFTGAGALSPQLLDRVYSFLDWDGWSGERVVLRPDSTLPAVRWFDAARANPSVTEWLPARLSYVQPVYRFDTGDEARELWQCGVELFGAGAPTGDVELLGVACELLKTIGIPDLRFEIAHAGLMRSALAATGQNPIEQLETYERVLQDDQTAIDELLSADPERASALRILLEVRGGSEGYLENIGASLTSVLPDAVEPLAELRAAVQVLTTAKCTVEVVPATVGNFEYYTGLTFRALSGTTECLRGGRYDLLAAAIGGQETTASGFAGDLLRLASLAPSGNRP